MRSKINKVVIALFSLLLTVSFSAEAGYKSSYNSSYRSSYKSSSSSRSYSTPSSSTSIKSSSSSYSSKPLSTGTKAATVGAGAAISAGAVSASEKSSGGLAGSKDAEATSKSASSGTVGAIAAKKSATGAELVDKKGKIVTSSNTTTKSTNSRGSDSIPGVTNKSSLSYAAPSQNLTKTIIERDRSNGFSWSHLAMLYWLTSSSNSHASSLSSSDKDWIQQQIKEQESSGESREAAISELKAAGVDTSTLKLADDNHHADKPSVSFSYDMPKAFTADHVWVFVVTASQDGKQQAPSCELQGATFMAKQDKLFVKWKAPATAGQKTEMKCKAFGGEEVRTLVSA
ncbi:hypothetical protein J7S78_13350 [Klebsiella oxytoca]|uniref:Uncharacterized protein n=1 Tax=Klebsiella oxytoca TaxID=571 RepID=A0AAP2FLH0_KLEOX|nr:hypothetical protein [Klebsiella oxytoca]MBQ0600777.1 hypothetical protein [Klebsiella oxytoca]